MVCVVYKNEKSDASASTEVVAPELKERFVQITKIGFWVFTAVICTQIFMKAVYFANL